jgi:hypothetical protein
VGPSIARGSQPEKGIKCRFARRRDDEEHAEQGEVRPDEQRIMRGPRLVAHEVIEVARAVDFMHQDGREQQCHIAEAIDDPHPQAVAWW